MSDDWRDFGEHEWDRIRAYAAELLHQREEIGRRSYGSGLLGGQFRGDPITHLENEIGDALAYAYFISRQREYLESELARRDALLREGRELAMAARVCEYPGERQALAERLRDWEQRVAELETDVF